MNGPGKTISLLTVSACLAAVVVFPAYGAESGVDGKPPGVAASVAAVQGLLARGNASEAVRLGNSVRNEARGKLEEKGYQELVLLLAQGYLKLGMHRSASDLLTERLAEVPAGRPDEQLPLLNLLGEAAILAGHPDEAEPHLAKAARLARQGREQDRIWTLLLQSQLRYRQKRNSEALALCREAELSAAKGNGQLLAFALVQRGQIARQSGDAAQAAAAYREALSRYRGLPDTDDTVNGILAVASGLARLSAAAPANGRELLGEATDAVRRAAVIARRISDWRALSQCHGKLGEMLAGGGDLDGALRETRLALHYAQQNRIGDLSYVWQHQTGRVLRKQGHTAKAIEMYRAAARNLNLLRKGLPADCGLAEGAFQETVKPVYLELAELLIDSSAGSSDRNEEQRLLMEARQTVESLRAEELRDYFADACLGAERSDRMRLDATPPNTAIFYIVNFPDRLELLVSFPDGIKRVKVAESSATVGREARLLRLTMENRFPVWTVPAGKLYDWLIRPVEADLKRNDVRTIVFVPDGPLRNIPLSVLHDGKRSIINSYAVATIQGLGFTSGNSDASLKKAGILLAGISESVQGYPALSNVQDELSGIRMSHAGSMLLNSDFNVQRVKELLDASSYPLIHFASHGEFTGDARNNYILTWDGRMTLDHLDSFIRKSATRKAPVAVLALSACRTAAGDDRASLGLAGLAVKSGAHSAVASLWDIDDKSTAELFVEFYRILGGGGSVSRAEALRGAQLHIQKKYEHPYYWSPFLLIGDWF